MRNRFFVVCDKGNGMEWYFQNIENAIRCFYQLSVINGVKYINEISVDDLIASYENLNFLVTEFCITNEKVSVFQKIFND